MKFVIFSFFLMNRLIHGCFAKVIPFLNMGFDKNKTSFYKNGEIDR